MSGLIKPNQDMANAVILELARGRRKVPAYAPFIAPEIADAPWPVASSDHSAAIIKWRNNARIAKRDLPPGCADSGMDAVSVAFSPGGRNVGDLSYFGGFPAGLSHLAIVLNMAAANSVAVSMAYGRPAQQHLDANARARSDTTLGGGYVAYFMSNENADCRLQAATECAPRPQPVKNTQSTIDEQECDGRSP